MIMMQKYIDTGVNLTGSSFTADVDEVIERALAVGVQRLIITGTDMQHNLRAIELCERYPGVCYCTAGIHPHHARDYTASLYSELVDLQAQECVVAVGECGLDFNRNYSTREQQLRAFEAQLEIASETGKPLFLHQRDAHDDFVAMLKSCRDDLGQSVAHCFTGSLREAEEYLALGLYIGITGWICDERRGSELRRAVSSVPLDRLMLETDAPYLLPRDLEQQPARKRRNEPCFLPHIASAVAGHMDVDEDRLVAAAYRNSCRFFGLDH